MGWKVWISESHQGWKPAPIMIMSRTTSSSLYTIPRAPQMMSSDTPLYTTGTKRWLFSVEKVSLHIISPTPEQELSGGATSSAGEASPPPTLTSTGSPSPPFRTLRRRCETPPPPPPLSLLDVFPSIKWFIWKHHEVTRTKPRLWPW